MYAMAAGRIWITPRLNDDVRQRFDGAEGIALTTSHESYGRARVVRRQERREHLVLQRSVERQNVPLSRAIRAAGRTAGLGATRVVPADADEDHAPIRGGNAEATDEDVGGPPVDRGALAYCRGSASQRAESFRRSAAARICPNPSTELPEVARTLLPVGESGGWRHVSG